MKTRFLLSCLAIIFLLAALPVYAQYGESQTEEETAWKAKAGFFFPNGDTVDASELTLGIEYETPVGNLFGDEASLFSLTIDVTRITTTTPLLGQTENVTLIPILLNLKRTSRDEEGSGFWQYGVGLGAFWADEPINYMRLDEGTSFAWQLMFSYHFNPAFFIEGRFIAGENTGDDGLFGAEIGYSF